MRERDEPMSEKRTRTTLRQACIWNKKHRKDTIPTYYTILKIRGQRNTRQRQIEELKQARKQTLAQKEKQTS